MKYVCVGGNIHGEERKAILNTCGFGNEREGWLSETIKNRAIHVTMITGQSE
jgi:hypothetical protein